jgi:glycosyltransferase involved in cell wall biosynthesis
VRVHRLPRIGHGILGTTTYLLALFAFLLLRLRRYDLVHVHLANLQADVAVVAAKIRGRPTYLKLAAGGPLGEIGRMRKISVLTRLYGIRHATLVQAISEEIAADLRAIGVPPARIRMIPNGVEIPGKVLGSSERSAARRKLHVPDGAQVFLFIGRMERDKGVADLLEVWRIGGSGPGLLLLVGNPGMKRPVSIEDLPAGVEYHRWSSDVRSYLEAADVLVLPSHGEGMSNTLLEAMALGLCVVASRVGAAPEMIEQRQSGLLVKAGDIPALRNALMEIAEDTDSRHRMGRAARAAVIARYGIESVASQIDAVYRSIEFSP